MVDSHTKTSFLKNAIIKAAEKQSLRLFCGKNRHFGPSGETRTPGIQLPKLARYQLRYTRLFDFYAVSAVVVKDVVKRRFSEFLQRSKSAKTPVFARGCGIYIFRSASGVLHAPKAGALPTALHPDIRLLQDARPGRLRQAAIPFGEDRKIIISHFVPLDNRGFFI